MLSSQMIETAGNPDNAPRLQPSHSYSLLPTRVRRLLSLSFSISVSPFLCLSYSLISLSGSLVSLSLASLSLHEADSSLLLHKTNDKTFTIQPYFAHTSCHARESWHFSFMCTECRCSGQKIIARDGKIIPRAWVCMYTRIYAHATCVCVIHIRYIRICVYARTGMHCTYTYVWVRAYTCIYLYIYCMYMIHTCVACVCIRL